MERKEIKLRTGVTTSFKKSGGEIEVLSPYMTVIYNNVYKQGITNVKLI